MYYRGAAAAIIVYDITRASSFNTLKVGAAAAATAAAAAAAVACVLLALCSLRKLCPRTHTRTEPAGGVHEWAHARSKDGLARA